MDLPLELVPFRTQPANSLISERRVPAAHLNTHAVTRPTFFIFLYVSACGDITSPGDASFSPLRRNKRKDAATPSHSRGSNARCRARTRIKRDVSFLPSSSFCFLVVSFFSILSPLVYLVSLSPVPLRVAPGVPRDERSTRDGGVAVPLLAFAVRVHRFTRSPGRERVVYRVIRY